MSIMDELKKLTRPYDEDNALIEDDDVDLDADVDEPAYSRTTTPPVTNTDPVMGMGGAAGMGAMGGMGTGMGGSMGAGLGVNDIPRNTSAPISMGSMTDNSKYRVVLVKPEEFDAATVIAKHICQGDTVILNCEETDKEVARRVIDFLSGCAFALEGSIKKASSSVIIIAPKDVGVDDAKDGEQLNA